MKKILLIATTIVMSLLSCKKEPSLDTENNIESYKNAYKPYYKGFYINNIGLAENGIERFVRTGGCWDMSNVFVHFKRGESGNSWGIEYLSVGEWPIVKFWHVVTFCKWRAIDVDWRNPQSDGSINSVTYEINDHPNQEWKLIGIGDPHERIKSKAVFQGVIVNMRTGQMLEMDISMSTSFQYNIFTRDKWEGSYEKASFEKNGNWSGVTTIGGRRKLWTISTY